MKEKGKFFWKKRWISICSIHLQYNENCNICNTGTWENVWLSSISGFIYDYFPNFWKWYVNLNKYQRINRIKKLK